MAVCFRLKYIISIMLFLRHLALEAHRAPYESPDQAEHLEEVAHRTPADRADPRDQRGD